MHRSLHRGTPCMRVAYPGDLNVVQRLIANRANVNTKTENNKGYTTIVYAGTNNQAEVIKVLLPNKADGSTRNSDGMSVDDRCRPEEPLRSVLGTTG
mmetsp:Transcript_63423/g.125472  ORF Transcript_63423/g.125472 Transcript_63423/m.125472 type:complete len:97 (+) Transcript_63423:58-348(+)